jgi:hypothetical protein
MTRENRGGIADADRSIRSRRFVLMVRPLWLRRLRTSLLRRVNREDRRADTWVLVVFRNGRSF